MEHLAERSFDDLFDELVSSLNSLVSDAPFAQDPDAEPDTTEQPSD